jgi:DNA-directed RNA polymerase subunit K/omega
LSEKHARNEPITDFFNKNMDYRKLNAPQSTITRDMNTLCEKVGNSYETVVIIAKRANQIDQELKAELDKKLEEFSSMNDSIEEVFENREQIEISRYYEKLPKATLLATQEFIEDKIYYRNPLKEKIKK